MENNFELTELLPPEIKKVWLISDLISLFISCAIVFAGFFIIHTLGENRQLFFIGWIILSVLLIIWRVVKLLLINYRYQFHRFKIDTDDIAIQKGYFFRQTTYVPINRIQHVETNQGPLLRHEKLMAIEIHTAATTHEIGGLRLVDAKKIRENIIALVKVAKEDV